MVLKFEHKSSLAVNGLRVIMGQFIVITKMDVLSTIWASPPTNLTGSQPSVHEATRSVTILHP